MPADMSCLIRYWCLGSRDVAANFSLRLALDNLARKRQPSGRLSGRIIPYLFVQIAANERGKNQGNEVLSLTDWE